MYFNQNLPTTTDHCVLLSLVLNFKKFQRFCRCGRPNLSIVSQCHKCGAPLPNSATPSHAYKGSRGGRGKTHSGQCSCRSKTPLLLAMQCPYSLVRYFCVLTTWLYWRINSINYCCYPHRVQDLPAKPRGKEWVDSLYHNNNFLSSGGYFREEFHIMNEIWLGLIIIHWMTDLICGHWIIDCIFTIPRAVLKSTAPISCISCHKIRLRNYFKCGRCGDVFKSRPLVDKTPPETTKSTEGDELGESSNQKKGIMSHDTLGINTITPTSNGKLRMLVFNKNAPKNACNTAYTQTYNVTSILIYFPTCTHVDLSDFSDFGRNIVTLDLADTLAPLFIQREEECKEQLPQVEEEMEGTSIAGA